MKRTSRFLTRRTMVNVVGALVVVSMLVGAAWPAGTVAHVTSRPHQGRITPLLQEGTPMTDTATEPTTVNGLELLLGESTALQTAYAMRQELAAVWERSNASREHLLQALQDWCERAENSGVRQLQELSLRLRSYVLS